MLARSRTYWWQLGRLLLERRRLRNAVLLLTTSFFPHRSLHGGDQAHDA